MSIYNQYNVVDSRYRGDLDKIENETLKLFLAYYGNEDISVLKPLMCELIIGLLASISEHILMVTHRRIKEQIKSMERSK